jgi:hypothetical protein
MVIPPKTSLPDRLAECDSAVSTIGLGGIFSDSITVNGKPISSAVFAACNRARVAFPKPPNSGRNELRIKPGLGLYRPSRGGTWSSLATSASIPLAGSVPARRKTAKPIPRLP